MLSKQLRVIFIILLGIVFGLLLWPSNVQAGELTVFTTAQADAYVNESFATTNFGAATSLLSQNEPTTITYIRFQVPANIPSTDHVYLRFYNASSGTNQIYLFASSSSSVQWNESLINYVNRPPLGTLVGVGGAPSGWVDVSVDSTVRQAAGNYITFAFTHLNGYPLTISSRELPSYMPRLILSGVPDPQECNGICPP